MIEYVKFNNDKVVGYLAGRKFNFRNDKLCKPYQTIIFCGQNGTGKTTFFNYFKITKSVNEKIYQKYELNKYINDKNFCDFNYCSKKYRAYFPSELTLPYEYPASLIKEIENDQWIELPTSSTYLFQIQKNITMVLVTIKTMFDK